MPPPAESGSLPSLASYVVWENAELVAEIRAATRKSLLTNFKDMRSCLLILRTKPRKQSPMGKSSKENTGMKPLILDSPAGSSAGVQADS
jgi:hypothetical protein